MQIVAFIDHIAVFFIGPSGVHALSVGVAAKQSVHYFWDYFSFLSSFLTYWSSGRLSDQY
jgi:hypothetical protein